MTLSLASCLERAVTFHTVPVAVCLTVHVAIENTGTISGFPTSTCKTMTLAANADRVHHRYYECAWEYPTVLNSRCHNGEKPPHLRCNFAAALPFNERPV